MSQRGSSPKDGPLLRQAEAPNARSHDAYAYLLTELLEGELQPNDWLSVVDIASTLNCSRVPVMEAIKRLAADGFLTILPQVGCRVAVPDPNEVLDFFAFFAAAEGCVTRLAAARRTKDDLNKFRVTCMELDRILKNAGGPAAHDPAYRRANLVFHTAIHQMARAPMVSRIAASLWNRSDFYIKVAFGSLHFTQRVRRAHLAIRRAIIGADAGAAEAAVEGHLRAVGDAISQRLITARAESNVD
ncbi:MAG: GntR family transcriptional regulator [Gammaproteobacteria bacterium]|nr:GntR family transcriptional regulator [Gammaproteobacteria bacterium]